MSIQHIYDNNDLEYKITFRDGRGEPVDISGYSVRFMVKSSVNDADADAVINVVNTVHTDATNGVTTFDLSNTLTNIGKGSYLYEIQTIDTSDNITTVIQSKFVVHKRLIHTKA